MAKAEVCAGQCGFTALVEVRSEDGRQMQVSIESECPALKRLAEELGDVDAFEEVLRPKRGGKVQELACDARLHKACPVPVAVVKAIEIEAGLGIPADVTIKLSR